MSDAPQPTDSAQVKCASCASMVAADLKFCPNCGASLQSLAAAPSIPANEQPPAPPPSATVRCAHCGTEYAASNSFCPSCGTARGAIAPAPQVVVVNQGQTIQGKATTALLAEIIGGYFGFLGIGHIIAGNVGLGLAFMFGWWMTLVILGVLSALTGVCLLVLIPVYFAVPIGSGVLVRQNILKTGV